MDIIFIRHGETKENKRGVYGSFDTTLSQIGIEQILKAKELVQDISFERVYISPLKRTMETAELLGLKGDFDRRIQEINFGIFEGKTYEEIKRDYPEETYTWTNDYIYYRIPNGESLMDLYSRTANFLEDIVSKDKNALVITHEGVIRCALCWVFDNVEYFYRFKLDNGSLTTISIWEGYKYIKNVNK
ncbi:MAG: Phosphoserine phosphatase 1 [Sporanaerobacter sp.]|jgi:alpha-ribazole phosphatase|uniref:histidine phosphatase family protein n=1 Tax=Sporanaerobacter sp. TaxID=2010183 RepID=UPI003A0FE4FA